MALLVDANNPIINENYNPTISLTEKIKGNDIEFPDPNTYFILSDAGKNYKTIDNECILLSLEKGYFESVFSLDFQSDEVIDFSSKLFFNDTPIEGDAKRALDLAIKKTAKRNTVLKNRL